MSIKLFLSTIITNLINVLRMDLFEIEKASLKILTSSVRDDTSPSQMLLTICMVNSIPKFNVFINLRRAQIIESILLMCYPDMLQVDHFYVRLMLISLEMSVVVYTSVYFITSQLKMAQMCDHLDHLDSVLNTSRIEIDVIK